MNERKGMLPILKIQSRGVYTYKAFFALVFPDGLNALWNIQNPSDLASSYSVVLIGFTTFWRIFGAKWSKMTTTERKKNNGKKSERRGKWRLRRRLTKYIENKTHKFINRLSVFTRVADKWMMWRQQENIAWNWDEMKWRNGKTKRQTQHGMKWHKLKHIRGIVCQRKKQKRNALQKKK